MMLAGVAACDPLYTLEVRQALRPAPAAECVARAVRHSPLVADMRPSDRRSGGETFYVILRDSAGAGAHWNGRVSRDAVGDTAGVLNVGYTWLGYARPGLEEAVKMEAAATALFTELRAACSPSAPAEAQCIRTGPFYERPCGAGYTAPPQ
ncbi:MAG: hypothetical protein ACJ8J0_17545 [Longimicrobiaceae bacterium]